MYLSGQKFFWTVPEKQREEDGFRVKTVDLELGYWRKHPNLHGYIVQAFANGEDDCREIQLSIQDMRNIISAIKENRLPHTAGFFFGTSEDSERQRKDDIAVFEQAIAWVEAAPGGTKSGPHESYLGEPIPLGGMVVREVKMPEEDVTEQRTVIYQASW